MTENEVGDVIVHAALEVHTVLGAGLLESAYETCLAYELEKAGLKVQKQLSIPIVYKEVQLEVGYRLDLLVQDLVIVEVKAVERLQPIHVAQALSYLKLKGLKLGYLLNFNVEHMRQGIRRVVNNL
jgi:GxxExxY protein